MAAIAFETDAKRPLRVVELGAGTGEITAHLLDFEPEELLAIEINPVLHRHLFRLKNDRQSDGMKPILEDALSYLERMETESVDAVVSSLAWSALPASKQRALVHEVVRVLRPGGRLVLYRYRFAPHWKRLFSRLRLLFEEVCEASGSDLCFRIILADKRRGEA